MYIIACEYCDTQISSYLFIQLSRMNWRTDSTHQNKFVTLQLGLLITTINKNESRPHAKIINFNHPTNTFVFVFFFYFDFVHFFCLITFYLFYMLTIISRSDFKELVLALAIQLLWHFIALNWVWSTSSTYLSSINNVEFKRSIHFNARLSFNWPIFSLQKEKQTMT